MDLRLLNNDHRSRRTVDLNMLLKVVRAIKVAVGPGVSPTAPASGSDINQHDVYRNPDLREGDGETGAQR